MGRILGQLRCGGCRVDFYPDLAASGQPVVLCPECGAGHVNPDGLPSRHPDYPQLSSHRRRVCEWALRHWGDELPSSGRSSPLAAEASTCGAQDGYHYCAARAPGITSQGAYLTMTFVMVAALPPPAGAAPPEWSWARAGAWMCANRAIFAAELESIVSAAIDALRRIGAEPLHPLEEVEAASPLDAPARVHEHEEEIALDPRADAALESLAVRCSGCGAPCSVTALVRGRCPYCGASQALAPELERALNDYHRRVHVAQLSARAPSLFDAFLGPAPPPSPAAPDAVRMACVRCGAPSAHRPGAVDEHCESCGAALIPSEVARRRGLHRSATAAADAQRDELAVHQQRQLSMSRVRRALGMVQIALLGIPVLLCVPYFVWLAARSVTDELRAALIAAGATLLALALVALTGWTLGRRMKKVADRYRSRLDVLASQLGAPAVGDSGLLRRWARQWWTDRLAPWWLHDYAAGGVICAQAAGFPAALSVAIRTDVSVLPFHFGGRPQAHLAVLVAATLPRDVSYWAGRGETARFREELERAGFHLELRSGGLAVRAGDDAIARIRREPDRLAGLAPLVHGIAQLAHHLRAELPRAT